MGFFFAILVIYFLIQLNRRGITGCLPNSKPCGLEHNTAKAQ